MKTYLIKSNEMSKELSIIEIETRNISQLNKWINDNEGYFDNFTLFTEDLFKLLKSYDFKKVKKIKLNNVVDKIKQNYYKWDEI